MKKVRIVRTETGFAEYDGAETIDPHAVTLARYFDRVRSFEVAPEMERLPARTIVYGPTSYLVSTRPGNTYILPQELTPPNPHRFFRPHGVELPDESANFYTVWAGPQGSRRWVLTVDPDRNVLLFSEIAVCPTEVVKGIFDWLESEGLISQKTWDDPLDEPVEVSLGGDPEFELFKDGRLEYARDHFNSLHDELGRDGSGAQVELRPEPATEPEGVLRNFRELLRTLRNEGYDVSARGDVYPLGGHIHFGVPEFHYEFLEALDDFVGTPTQILSGLARGSYGRLSDYRLQPHGFEYRVIPAAVWSHPRMARITLQIAKAIVQRLANGEELEYNDPPTVEDYQKVAGLSRAEVRFFLRFCERRLHERFQVFAAWRMEPEEQGTAVRFHARSWWEPWAGEEVSKVFHDLRFHTRILLFGLAEDRGDVFTFPCRLGTTVRRSCLYNPYTTYGFSMSSRKNRDQFRQALKDLRVHLIRTGVASTVRVARVFNRKRLVF